LGLPVLADPFWGRPPWLDERRDGKHSKQKEFRRVCDCARVRAAGLFDF
jgi:hypothetical protein